MGYTQKTRPIKTSMLQCNMTTVNLDCKDKDIYDIIDWCEQEIGTDKWTFANQFPSHTWQFGFPSPEQATLFRLKWR